MPIGYIGVRQDERSAIEYHYALYLQRALEPGREIGHARIWLGGALTTLGDALTRSSYFDRDPLLEVVRHMRNAIGHGNRFEIREPWRLENYPAHTTRTLASGASVPLAITPELDGTQCLFDFMTEDEVLSLIQRVEMHLSRLAGDIPDGVDHNAVRADVFDEWRRSGIL